LSDLLLREAPRSITVVFFSSSSLHSTPASVSYFDFAFASLEYGMELLAAFSQRCSSGGWEELVALQTAEGSGCSSQHTLRASEQRLLT
jgi:hypothetical protein